MPNKPRQLMFSPMRGAQVHKEEIEEDEINPVAQYWLNMCNLTNLQQKLEMLRHDPAWAATYDQLSSQLTLHVLPRSQLVKNKMTYQQLLEEAKRDHDY